MSSSNNSTSNLTPSMSKLPEIFIRHICSIREASMDTAHNTPMIDSDLKVVNFDKVKEEYRCSLPRKTQKTDTQNEKNAPEHHVQERFLLPINGISPLFLPVQFLINASNMLQDLPQHISVLPSVQSVLPSVRRRSSCCIF